MHVRVSVSVELEAIHRPLPPRERIASHAIRAWYQGPYSSLTILSSPRAALPQTRASRHARNRNPPRTTTPHLKWDPRVWPPTATTRRPGRPNRLRASLSVMSRRLQLPIRRRARSPPRAPSPLVGIAGIAFSSTVALESKSRESPPTWNRPLSDPPPSRCPPPMRPPPRRRPKAAPAAADEQPGRTPPPRPPPPPPKGGTRDIPRFGRSTPRRGPWSTLACISPIPRGAPRPGTNTNTECTPPRERWQGWVPTVEWMPARRGIGNTITVGR